jgi:hypothetical protein
MDDHEYPCKPAVVWKCTHIVNSKRTITQILVETCNLSYLGLAKWHYAGMRLSRSRWASSAMIQWVYSEAYRRDVGYFVRMRVERSASGVKNVGVGEVEGTRGKCSSISLWSAIVIIWTVLHWYKKSKLASHVHERWMCLSHAFSPNLVGPPR